MKKFYFVFLPVILAMVCGLLVRPAHAAVSTSIFVKKNLDGSQTLKGHVPSDVALATFKYHSNFYLNAQIIMPLGNQSQLSSLLKDLYDPKSPSYHHFLTPAQFAQQFAASSVDSTIVKEFLQKQGISVLGQSAGGTVLKVAGHVSAFENAFGLHINNYQRKDGRIFFAPDADPTIPPTLADKILAVGGLDNLPKYRSHAHQSTNALPKAVAGPSFLTPQDVLTAY